MLGLILVQTVCKGYQQMILAGKEIKVCSAIIIHKISFFFIDYIVNHSHTFHFITFKVYHFVFSYFFAEKMLIFTC